MQSLIDQDLSAANRRQKLRPVVKAALDLAHWAAEGQSDYVLAAQLSLLVRHFSQAVTVPENYPNLAERLDSFGASIQVAVGMANKPQMAAAARKAVAPIHETELEPTGAK